MDDRSIKIGMNARIFANNWRPLGEEIKFAQDNGFQSIQVSVRDWRLDQELLGDRLDVVAKGLDEANLELAIELVIEIDAKGQTSSGETPLEILKRNIKAINILKCKYVHWHLVPLGLASSSDKNGFDEEAIQNLEKLLIPQFFAGVLLSEKNDIKFGFEHNEPDLILFGKPKSCKMLLDAVPGLKFVWDINHTVPDHLTEFQELVTYASIIHVSDTKLPEVNYHLPLGEGTIDFECIAKILLEKCFFGPAIFEIGGLLKSGGYGRDTNDALIESYQRFKKEIDMAKNGAEKSKTAT